MSLHRGSRRPTRLNFLGPSSGFVGEYCPLCHERKLTSIHKYPICTGCRDKYGINIEGQLKKLSSHRLMIDEKSQGFHMFGTMDNAKWEASYIDESWSVNFIEEIASADKLSSLISEILAPIKAPVASSLEKRPFRRYAFVAAIGGILVTAAVLTAMKRRREKEMDEDKDL